MSTEHAVVIAGGGPTGLMLGAELALAGVDVAIVERRESRDLIGLRAGGLHIRTLEMLDQRGIVDRFVSQGQVIRVAPFARSFLDISDIPTRHNYYLALWQTRIEVILADWIQELGVHVYRSLDVNGFTQRDDGVEVELSGGGSMQALYLVGCDGGRSLIRKKARIDFPGWEPSTSYLIAEIETSEEPEWGLRRSEKGINAVARLEDGRARVVLSEREIHQGGEPTLRDFREAFVGVYGKDFGLRSATYLSRFTDMARQAASYREGRILLAGDAAHVHSPIGGQGLNVGVQDAVNLGWKLAQVVRGISPERLLDSYQAERHPVGARLLRNTMGLTALDRSEDRASALREMICEMMQNAETRKQYIAMISGLDIHYELGAGHPLLGRRMPDLNLVTADGSMRVYSLLHKARPLLLNFDEAFRFSSNGWTDRVQCVNAKYDGAWELPVVGTVPPPSAVLIRPDGYVGWVGDRTESGLTEALTTWFGPTVG